MQQPLRYKRARYGEPSVHEKKIIMKGERNVTKSTTKHNGFQNNWKQEKHENVYLGRNRRKRKGHTLQKNFTQEKGF